MNLLQIILTLTALFLIIVSFTTKKGKRFNLAHFFMFFTMWIGLLVFIFYPDVLNIFWKIFWVEKWADVLVYVWIIFLWYSALNVFRRLDSQAEDLTMLIRNLAIETSEKRELNWKYAFVIPGYNEWKVIRNTISNLLEKWYNNIIFINDWSKDDTLKNLKWLEEKIIILNHLKNRGQWAAIETWFEYLRRYGNVDFIVTYDSDWQHDIWDIVNFEKSINSNPKSQIFLWSRFLGSTKNMTKTRKIILKLGIIFTYFVSWIKLTDTHNWYRVIKKEVLNDIKITLDGMWHASEIIEIIANNNISYTEVPVTISYDEYSMHKWQKSSNAINIALKMIWNKFLK